MSTNGRRDNLWCIHIVENYLAIRGKSYWFIQRHGLDCHRQKKPDTKSTYCVMPQLEIQVCAQSVETFAFDINTHQKVSITEEMLNNQLTSQNNSDVSPLWQRMQ